MSVWKRSAKFLEKCRKGWSEGKTSLYEGLSWPLSLES